MWILCQSDFWNFLSQHAHLSSSPPPRHHLQSDREDLCVSLPPPAPTDLGRPSLRRILSLQLWQESRFPLSCFQICDTRGMTAPTSQCCWDSRTLGLVLGKWERPLAQGKSPMSRQSQGLSCGRPGIAPPCREQNTGQPCLTPA